MMTAEKVAGFVVTGMATIVMLVSSVICWVVVKTQLPGRWLLDNIASLPLVFPGVVLGLALMVFVIVVSVANFYVIFLRPGVYWIVFWLPVAILMCAGAGRTRSEVQ